MNTFGPNLKLWTSTQAEWVVSVLSGKTKIWLKPMGMLLLLFGVVGCRHEGSSRISTVGAAVPLQKEERRSFLILGFGIVTVEQPDEENLVTVVDQSSLGLYAGNQPGLKLGLGFQSSAVTSVPILEPEEGVVFEVTKKPFEQVEVVVHGNNGADL